MTFCFFLPLTLYLIFNPFYFEGTKQCWEDYGDWWAHWLCNEWIDSWCTDSCRTCSCWNSGLIFFPPFWWHLRHRWYDLLLLIEWLCITRITGFHMVSQWRSSQLPKHCVILLFDLVKEMKNPWLASLILFPPINFLAVLIWRCNMFFFFLAFLLCFCKWKLLGLT